MLPSCYNHPDLESTASCARCGQPLCISCAYFASGQPLCREDYLQPISAPAYQQVLIEDYRGPLNATTPVVSVPPLAFVAPFGWLDEPSAATITELPAVAMENHLPSDFNVSTAYGYSDRVSDWGGWSILWSLASFLALLLGELLAFVLSHPLGAALPAVLIKWVAALPALATIAAGTFAGARAMINLRHSNHRGQILFIATIGLTMAALSLLFLIDFLTNDFDWR